MVMKDVTIEFSGSAGAVLNIESTQMGDEPPPWVERMIGSGDDPADFVAGDDEAGNCLVTCGLTTPDPGQGGEELFVIVLHGDDWWGPPFETVEFSRGGTRHAVCSGRRVGDVWGPKNSRGPVIASHDGRFLVVGLPGGEDLILAGENHLRAIDYGQIPDVLVRSGVAGVGLVT